MIILEGADCVGKTTLARKLSAQIAEIIGETDPEKCYSHMSRPAESFDHVAGYLQNIGPRAQDRYHLGAVVYGVMMSYGGAPNSAALRWIQTQLRYQGALVVVMYSDRDSLEARLRTNTKAEMYDRQTILEVNDIYRRVIAPGRNRGVEFCDVEIDVTDGWPTEDVETKLMELWRARWLV